VDQKPPSFPRPFSAVPPGFPPPAGAPAAAKPNFPPPPNFPTPGAPRFPGAAPAPVSSGGGPRPLVLPRRVSPLQRAQEASRATAEARKSIDAILSQSRPPWGASPALSGSQVENLEKAIRALEAKVAERDAAVADAQAKLAERERELAEAEALLSAREKVLEVAKQAAPAPAGGVSKEEQEALRKLKEELDRQEASLKEQRQALKEREEFLDQSEAALFEKMQAQQEKETELEQKEDDIRKMMRNAGLLKDEPKEPMEKA